MDSVKDKEINEMGVRPESLAALKESIKIIIQDIGGPVLSLSDLSLPQTFTRGPSCEVEERKSRHQARIMAVENLIKATELKEVL